MKVSEKTRIIRTVKYEVIALLTSGIRFSTEVDVLDYWMRLLGKTGMDIVKDRRTYEAILIFDSEDPTAARERELVARLMVRLDEEIDALRAAGDGS